MSKIEELERLHADLVAGKSFGVEWNKRVEEALPALLAIVRAAEALRDEVYSTDAWHAKELDARVAEYDAARAKL